MLVRRVTFRLYPNKKQEQVLRYHRRLHKDLYNAAVCNRFTQYQKFGHRNGKWFGAIGIDFGCKVALAVTNGETHSFVEAPKFLRKAEAKIKHLSQGKRRKVAPNRKKKQKASSWWKKAQAKISKVTRKVANSRQNWVHQVAAELVSSNSFAATEKLEVSKMTRKAKKGKRKKQKAGLSKSILDVGFGMLRSAIKYKVTEAGGVFVEVPTKTVKPSQTCPNCGNQHQKTLDERVHQCKLCGFTLDRDLAAALVMLLWSQGKLPGVETTLVDADVASSTSDTGKRKFTGSQKQLGQVKRQKSALIGLDAKTSPSTK